MYHGVTRKTDEASPEVEAATAPAEEEASSGSEKKERVLHTRVPAVLERELRRFADALRVPVSNVVRTILEDALSVADAAGGEVETRLERAAKQVGKERQKLKQKLRPDPLSDVIAYQAVKLAQPAECARCGAALEKGASANLGLTDGPSDGAAGKKRRFVCNDCVAGS
jgi:hypothetical protein